MHRRDLWRLTGAVAALCLIASHADAAVDRFGQLSAESKAAITQTLEQ